ncbi:putative Type I protein exporter [Helianthus annuus]|uniref:Type I protein exporter n=1 Tax=Helianthus annuus TaxID=4232 RepID=A0A9K3HVX8_HELAN|nr:putative Type I protein exporter [Helianthus annuus]
MARLVVSQSSSFAPYTSKAKSFAVSVFAILDRNDESSVTLDSVKGEIELRHISFKYPVQT